VARRSRVVNSGRSTTEDVEPLIDIPHEKKACIGGDLCTLEVNADESVKIRPYGFYLYVTYCAQEAFPSTDEFTI